MLPTTQPKESLSLLGDFEFVPGSAVQVRDSCVLALYKNPREETLYALAMFTADGGPAGCDLKDFVAYSVFDAAA